MPQPHENARVFIVIILLLWLVSTPDNGPSLISIPSLTSARLARQRLAHGVLNSTKWGDFSPRLADDTAGAAPRYLNLTGFREHDGYAWEDLGRFRDRCLEWSRNANPSSADDDSWDLGLAEPTWQNATGVVHGEWVRHHGSVARQAASYNLSDMTPGMSWVGARGEWSRNVTGAHGRIILQLSDKDANVEHDDVDGAPDGGVKSGGLAREISASVTIQDVGSGGRAWGMRLHGVHWPRQGAILLTSTSEKFAGIFGLPHLTLSRNFFHSSQRLLNETLDSVLRRKEKNKFSDPSNPWASNPDGQGESWNYSPHCEYVVYAQIHPLDYHELRFKYIGPKAREDMGILVKGIEDELRNPTGAPIRSIPELQVSAVMWSPDCSFFLETKGPPLFPSTDGQHLVGMKEEVLLYQVKVWLLAFAAVLYGQTYLVKSQIRESSTPSTIGRISFYTASIMVLADGLIFASASAVWCVSATTTLLPSLVVTFAAFMSMIMVGSLLSEVYKIQEPERRNREREQGGATSTRTRPPPTPAAAAAAAATARVSTGVSDLPRPVTAGQAQAPVTPPIIIPSDQDIDAEIAGNTAQGAAAVPTSGTAATRTTAGAVAQQQDAATFSTIIGRFVLLGTLIVFLSVAATSSPAPVRATYFNLLAFSYMSLWVPQIWRNIQRNSRRAYSWRFMIGQSVLRLLPLAYFYLREDNIFFADPDWTAFAVLAGWLWVQLWILAFQDVLGPRYGLPKGWAPEAWEYHPVLREDGLEAGGLPIGLVSSASESGSPELLDGVRSLSVGGQGGGGGGEDGRKREKEQEGAVQQQRSSGKAVHTHTIDCAICREVLEVPVVPAGADPDAVGAGGSVAAVLARRLYMVTPCRHVFHSACLEGWLRFRLQCPICREELPPL